VAVISGALLAVALAGILACLLALSHLSSARRLLVDRIDPSQTAALRLSAAMVNEETGVRGYALGGRPVFLDPYVRGVNEQLVALNQLERLSSAEEVRQLRADLQRVKDAIGTWRKEYALPVITAVRREGAPAASAPDLTEGKSRFDRVRASLDSMAANLSRARGEARSRLSSAARTLLICVLLVGVLLVGSVLITGYTLRRVVGAPLDRLLGQVRRVARGELRRPIEPSGPKDMHELGGDVESMRKRIVTELEAVQEIQTRLEVQARDLERSNAELEQFAYVASHDLQEPLRKVASFCQALERRYGDQLDERAKQYIDFAVDGAKRMQILINDLLAFSGVGRAGEPFTPVDSADVVDIAVRNLDAAAEQEDAQVIVDGQLPTVLGDASLLTMLFQNLIGNAMKFHGEDPPVVRIDAELDGDEWLWSVSDNGIGIEAAYADRIFVIFQRLHNKESYAGTGIGLAMCRKIVEYHGGRIWLHADDRDGSDAESEAPAVRSTGTTFHFTIPVIDQETA
jgi:signal transduction histidine kinase